MKIHLFILCVVSCHYIKLANAQILCHYEVSKLATLDCIPIGEDVNILSSSANLGEFNNWNNIEGVNLKLNNIAQIEAGLFTKIKSIKHLDLSHNRIFDLGDDTFSQLNRLQTLNLSSNSIVSADPNCFRGLTELKVLDFSSHLVDIVSPSLMASLKNLVKLDVSRVPFIHADSLNLGPTFKTLIATDTYIQFTDKTFAKATQLIALFLSRAHLESLPERLFNPCPNLKIIDLSQNNLGSASYMFNTIFSTNVELSVLDLSRNNFTTLNAPNIFMTNTKLKVVDVSFNMLTTLHPLLFNNNKNIIKLNLSNNRLSTLPPLIFKNLANLIDFDLSNNLLTKVPQLPNSTLLSSLNLAGNKLKMLSSNMFQYNAALKFLHLSNNKLETIPESSILELKQLNELDLSRNLLRTLSPRFLSTIGVGKMFINCNRFTVLNGFSPNRQSMLSLGMHGNPWECSCFLKMVESFRTGVDYDSIYFTDGNFPSCSYGTNVGCNENNLSEPKFQQWLQVLKTSNLCQ